MALLVLASGFAGCVGAGQGPDDPRSVAGDGPVGAATRTIEVDIVAMRCPEGYDNQQADDICLAYNGQIPGPTWIFEVGEQVNITLRHRVAETMPELGPDEQPASDIVEARYSLHRHGVNQDACFDGVAQPAGTQVCDSTVGPGESITYTFDAESPGSWHYHDHAHTFNVEAARGPTVDGHGVARGLWGSFVVLQPGEATEQVFDLHVTDAGANSGLGLDSVALEGARFDLNVVGLGYNHRFYHVRLDGPGGDPVGEVLVGPGVSRSITVAEAKPGTYTWTAEGVPASTPYTLVPTTPETMTGTITVSKGGSSASAESVPAVHDRADQVPLVPDQVVVIPFNHEDATMRAEVTGSMGLPLLEAKIGEILEFRIVSNDVVPHVFHLHGHTWIDPETGDLIDAVPLVPGGKETHTFTIVAGGEDGHTGDWLYHCHVGFDSANAAMWGVLRVHG